MARRITVRRPQEYTWNNFTGEGKQIKGRKKGERAKKQERVIL